MRTETWMKRRAANSLLFEYDWYQEVPVQHRPADLKLDMGVPCLTMRQYSLERRPMLRQVYQTAHDVLWKPDLPQAQAQPQPQAYASYICDLADTTLEYEERRQTQRFMNALCAQKQSAFTRVARCHGDLTMDNVLLDDDATTVIFIDPGNTRGLACQELDEAKLLQSAEGWHGYMLHDGLPFKVRYVHRLLLLTHYIRLYSHPELHSTHWLQWTKNRIDNMLFSPLGGLLR